VLLLLARFAGLPPQPVAGLPAGVINSSMRLKLKKLALTSRFGRVGHPP